MGLREKIPKKSFKRRGKMGKGYKGKGVWRWGSAWGRGWGRWERGAWGRGWRRWGRGAWGRGWGRWVRGRWGRGAWGRGWGRWGWGTWGRGWGRWGRGAQGRGLLTSNTELYPCIPDVHHAVFIEEMKWVQRKEWWVQKCRTSWTYCKPWDSCAFHNSFLLINCVCRIKLLNCGPIMFLVTPWQIT